MRAPGRLSARVWVLLVGCGCAGTGGPAEPAPPAPAAAASQAAHPTVIAIPASLRGLPTGELGPDGEPVVVPCASCHAGRDAGPVQLPEGRALAGPHAGFDLQHGELACGACHDAARRDRLRLADGTAIALVEAIALCGQCHGMQRRDYVRGAHGGMNGHWDLGAGPRTRNHCVHCHDPHRPKYPRLLPAAPPRDRFFGGGKERPHG
jgi:hypothetical protein